MNWNGKARSIYLAIALSSGGAYAADEPTPATEPSQEVEPVSVVATKNPALLAYSSALAGLDAFEQHHDLAPTVSVPRFKLTPRASDDQLNLQGITLKITDDKNSLEIPIAADGSFTIPRKPDEFDSSAILLLNRKKGTLSGTPLVETPGLPANRRRLGDIRLECQIAEAVGKKETNFLMRGVVSIFLWHSDWCAASSSHFMEDAPAPIKAAVLTSGERTLQLKISKDKYYDVPLPDQSWPNDALIELQFADASTDKPAAVQ